MRKYVLFALSLLLALSSFAQKKEEDRLQESHKALEEILGTPDKGIPRDLLDKAACVVVYPSVKKAGFIVGGEYGRGAITCRSGEKFPRPLERPC